jgi:hypothetical protein
MAMQRGGGNSHERTGKDNGGNSEILADNARDEEEHCLSKQEQ